MFVHVSSKIERDHIDYGEYEEETGKTAQKYQVHL